MANKEGLEYYLVGGAVRDIVMGNNPKDKDYVVVGSSPEEMKKRGFHEVGVSNFPVFLDEVGDEYALARTEKKDGSGYKGFDVSFDDVSLKEDLRRRDLTINAMALDVEGFELIDPFDGVKHIAKERLVPVSESFKEDPIRVLRLARYAARFMFEPSMDSLSYSNDIKHELLDVPKERIKKEIKKALRQSKKPSVFIRVMDRVGALKYVIPRLNDSKQFMAGSPVHHQEGSVYNHTLMVMDEIAEKMNRACEDKRELAIWMALAHDLGKIEPGEHGVFDHRNHGKMGVNVCINIAKRLKLSKDVECAMKFAAGQHMRYKRIDEMRESKVIRFANRIKDNRSVDRELMYALDIADRHGRLPYESNLECPIMNIEPRLNNAEKAIDSVSGQDIMEKFDVEEGEKVGELLLQERVKKMKELEDNG